MLTCNFTGGAPDITTWYDFENELLVATVSILEENEHVIKELYYIVLDISFIFIFFIFNFFIY